MACDSHLLDDLGLFHDLQQYFHGPNNNILFLYGSPANLRRKQLMGTFQGAARTLLQNPWNKAMNRLRVSVDWIFGETLDYLKFLDFKEAFKLQLSTIGKMYIVCGLMQNARTCMYGNETTS